MNITLITNNCTRYIFLVVTIIITTSGIYAQDELTLDQAWSIALQNNYTLLQQEKLIQKASEEISIQKTAYYPSLSSSAVLARAYFDQLPIEMPNNPDASGDVGIDLFSLTLNQPLFDGFQTKNLVKSANQRFKAQKIQKDILHNKVLIEVGNLYYDIQSNLLQQDVLNASIKRIDNQRLKILNLYRSEQATPFDTLEVANRKLEVENQLAILEDTHGILLSSLKYLLNEQTLPPILRLSTPAVQFSIKKLNDYLQSAMQKRPELYNISVLKQAQTSYSDMLKARYYPHLSASLAFNYLKPNSDLLKNDWTNFYSIFVNFQWELWNWERDSKKVQQARLDIDHLELQELQIIQDIRHQVRVAYQYLQSSKKKIILQTKLASQEKERFRITEDRYNQGLATFLDLNSSELALTSAQTELHKSYIDWYKNRLQLAFATGTIGDK